SGVKRRHEVYHKRSGDSAALRAAAAGAQRRFPALAYAWRLSHRADSLPSVGRGASGRPETVARSWRPGDGRQALPEDRPETGGPRSDARTLRAADYLAPADRTFRRSSGSEDPRNTDLCRRVLISWCIAGSSACERNLY